MCRIAFVFLLALFIAAVVMVWKGWWYGLLGLGALFVLGLLTLRLAVGFFARKIADAMKQAAAAPPPPARIALVPEPNPEWTDAEAVRGLAESLVRLGFQEAGTYRADPMPGVLLQGFAHVADRAYAVVYEHPQAGVWLDFGCEYGEGGGLTHTTSRHAGTLDRPPGYRTVALPGCPVPDLFRRFSEERRAVPLKPATPSSFWKDFEDAYAREMAWRDARGGPTEDEVRRVAEKSEMDVSEEQIKEATARLRDRARDADAQQHAGDEEEEDPPA